MNNAFVVTKTNLRADRVHDVLVDLAEAKWGKHVSVRRVGDIQWDLRALVDGVPDYRLGLCVWIKSPRKLVLRKYLGDLSTWFQAYFQEHLADELKGMCRHEFISGSTDPDPTPTETYQRWWLTCRGDDRDEQAALARSLRRVPAEFLGFG